MDREKLHGIQFARFVAAILVVLYHSERMLSVYMAGVPRIFTFGRAGLDFFFVLSGFIIYFVHHADIGRPTMLGRYLWRRVSRIYPIYWTITAAVIVASLLLGHGSAVLPLSHLVQSVLLIPHDREPIVGVAWTLSHEMLFYLLFATLVVSARGGFAVFLVWFLLMALNLARPLPPGPLAYVADSWHFEFLAGMAAAWLTHSGRVAAPRLLLAAGAAGFLAAGLFENAGLLRGNAAGAHVVYGCVSAVIVVGLACAERKGSPMTGAFGLRLGAWSYVLYLIHVFVVGYVAHALATLGLLRHVPAAVPMLLCAAASVALAATIHRWVERPLGIWLHTRSRRIPAVA